ncbi:MAG: Flp pilus assembly protein CpaB [Phycisphaerae bacterium]|nr:Flp pilus assembly protein CpaB [Phycisphaerae bacterium]NUQ44565.1 Flp pilus assembly protein CpaB [Phycisphaerae bacterium]
MKGKTVIPLVLGLGMGFVAIKIGINILKKAQAEPVDTVNVVVAGRPIDAASQLDKEMLKLAAVPKALVPPGAFSNIDNLVGRVPLVPISTGIALSGEMLAPVGAEPGLPSQIPDGYRAVAVKVDESTAVAGFVMPGHRVDIYALETPKSQTGRLGQPISKLLLEDVRVAAVGQSTKTMDPDGKTTRLERSVTLFVRPEDVPSLDVASRSTIRLALRGGSSKGEDAEKKREAMRKRFADLVSALTKRPEPVQVAVVEPPPAPVAKPQPQPPVEPPVRKHTLEIYRGSDVERVVYTGPEFQERVESVARNERPGGAPRNVDGAAPQNMRTAPTTPTPF